MGVNLIKSRWNKSGQEGSLDFYDSIGGGSVLTLARSGMIATSYDYYKTYFADANSTNTVNDGLSWGTCFTTMASALAASHASIAVSASRAWAKRNVIYAAGDAFVENLTKLAQKTDIIGVGSCDGFGPGARVQGNHVIDTGAYIGCRFINVGFLDNTTTGTILTLVQQNAAVQLILCDFLAGVSSVVGLLATAVTDLRLRGCRFLGGWNGGFSTAAISLGTGGANRTFIEDCDISGAAVGVLVNGGRTGTGSFIRRNYFDVTGKCINDASSTFKIVDNRGISAAAKGSALAGAVTGNVQLSANNNFTCSDVANMMWPAYGTI